MNLVRPPNELNRPLCISFKEKDDESSEEILLLCTHIDYGHMMAISQIIYCQYHIWDMNLVRPPNELN